MSFFAFWVHFTYKIGLVLLEWITVRKTWNKSPKTFVFSGPKIIMIKCLPVLQPLVS